MTPDRAGELAVRAVGVVAVATVAVALAGLTWRLTGWDDGRDEIVTAQAASPRVAGGPDPDVARILALAPFGGGATASGLPASALGLVLKGVLMAYPPEASLALISAGEGPALSYGVGAAVAGDAVIQSIEVDRVILKTGAGLEVLGFPPPVAGAVPTTSATPGAGIFITPPPGSAPQAAAPSPAAAAALAQSSPIATAQAAAQAASTPQPAPAAPTAAQLGATPAAGGGYRIGDNPSPELRRFGLQPGDVVETLNGQAVGDVAGDRALAQRALASGGATVVILRGGRRLTLTFPLR